MLLKLYSVRDAKAEAFLPVFSFLKDAQAIRAFETSVADPAHSFHTHSSDYALYYCGEFDDETGTVEPVLQPVLLDTASKAKSRLLTIKHHSTTNSHEEVQHG